jgi:predicted O-linked N-acetylglucosamine transferase (SPINDLY family)
LRGSFAEQGVPGERLVFEGRSPYGEYLESYGRVDLALDPFPFCGGVTSCESLWMGVPVVTLPGATFAGRHTLSFLTSLGLTDWIADSEDDYVDRAVRAAGDLAGLSRLRSELRGRMAASPLCDGPRFARQFLALQRQIAGGCPVA